MPIENDDSIWGSQAAIQKEQALAAPSGYLAAVRNAELLCETSPCQTVVIIRREDEIVIRDNSGIEGLTGDPLMHKTIALLEEIFERDNDQVHRLPDENQKP